MYHSVMIINVSNDVLQTCIDDEICPRSTAGLTNRIREFFGFFVDRTKDPLKGTGFAIDLHGGG